MLNILHDKVEKFFDILDEAALLIHEKAKKNYLDAFLITSDFIIGEDDYPELDTETVEKVKQIVHRLYDDSFNKEEIRKAFQITLLKAFKHVDASVSDITPDTIGILFAYFIDKFFKGNITVFDAACGTGNLLLSMMNNSALNFEKIYASDIDSHYINIACKLSDLLEYEIEFFNQNSLTPLFVPPADLVIADLPVETDEGVYVPYAFIETMMKYGKEGAYFLYLIPNDFFDQEHSRKIKDIIYKDTYIEALIELPGSMFGTDKFHKSILILRKQGENIAPVKEILMLSFPSFSDKDKVSLAIDKINQWFIHTNN